MIVREEWRWTDERGVQRLVGTDELRAALASGRLPVSTLVWREGMKEWVPAANRPELENAVAIGRAVLSRTSGVPNEGDRSTPTGIMPAKAVAVTKAVPAKPPELPTARAGRRADAPPLPTRAATRTLLGIPSPISENAATVPKVGPGPNKGVAPRTGVTQIPESGAPPDGNLAIPRAPGVPTLLVATAEGSRPQRKLTTRDIDGLWASTPLSDEDLTQPKAGREPLPSFDLPPAEEAPRAAPTAAIAASPGPAAPRPKPPLPTAAASSQAAKKAGSGVEASPDRKTSSTLPSRTLVGAAAAGPGAEKPAERPAAARPAAPPPPRASAGKAPPNKPPPLPGRQVTATLVAGPSTQENAAAPAAPVKTIEAVAPAPAAMAATPPAAAPEPPAEPVNGARVELREPVRSAPAIAAHALAPAEDPLHLPPHRAAPPGEGVPSGANGAAAQPTGRGPTPLGSAPSTHDGTSFPLPPAALRHDPLPSFESELDTVQPSEPPPALPSEPPPPQYLSEPPPGRSGRSKSSSAGLPVAVPMSSLFAAGGALITMVVAAFFAGRHSAQPTRLLARPVFHLVPLLSKAALPPPLKPCWVAKQPVMWAPRISKSIPFDMIATSTGTLAIGYAREESDAVGLEVTPSTGDVKVRFSQKGDAPIERVIPLGAEFKVSPAAGLGGFTSLIHVAASSPFLVGVKGGALSVADRPEGQASSLWPLSGNEAPSMLRVLSAGDKGYGVTFRRDGLVWGGLLDHAHKPVGALVKVPGSGGSVGKPSSGWNQRELAVIFADKPEGGERWEIRVGRAPGGTIPQATQVVPLPKGGPGGDAFAPDIAGLPDGRWLMIWTEGASGSRAVRAQTFAPDLTPLGDPIALSPPAGNFGQGGIGIASGYAAAVFLSKGSLGYELWGSILQCG